MAKINGFELKGVKEFKGHEGEDCYQGNIYYKNKKVGYFSSSYTMGPMDINFDDREVERIFNETLKAYIENFPEQFDGSGLLYPELNRMFDGESFIIELLNIKDWEKLVKKEFKKGYKSAVMIFDEGELENKEKRFKNRTFLILRHESSIDTYKPPKNHRVLRFIHSLAAFNIVF